MSGPSCESCYGRGWLMAKLVHADDGLSLDWRAFDGWQDVSPVVLAAALAGKVLKPCTCNPKRLAPWKLRKGDQVQREGEEAPF